ncbi:hypothetical protein [Fictibacillus gelatini]|uniref:hypothetical protein n=1 Tax=Fictibacillus gelatini TaxID=225985 RepID=UPI000421A87A|nr:hypothetical protein [Fictibacillus gelatini]
MKRKSFSIFFIKDTFSIGHLMEESLFQHQKSNEEQTNAKRSVEREAYRFRTTLSKMKGHFFIKYYEFHDSTAKIAFYGDFATYYRETPYTYLKKEDYLHYLGTEEAVHKLLLDSTIYLLKELPFLNELIIEVPNHGKKYSIHLTRREVDQFLNCHLSDKKDGHHTRHYFLCKEPDIKKFVAEFVKVKKLRKRL